MGVLQHRNSQCNRVDKVQRHLSSGKLAFPSSCAASLACRAKEKIAATVRGMTAMPCMGVFEQKGIGERREQVRDNIGSLIWNVSEEEAPLQVQPGPQGEPGGLGQLEAFPGSSTTHTSSLELTLPKPALVCQSPSPGFHRQQIPWLSCCQLPDPTGNALPCQQDALPNPFLEGAVALCQISLWTNFHLFPSCKRWPQSIKLNIG